MLEGRELVMQSDINEAFFCVPAGQTGGFLPFAVLEGRALAVQSGISEVFFCAPAGRTGGFLPFAVLEGRELVITVSIFNSLFLRQPLSLLIGGGSHCQAKSSLRPI